MSYFLTVCFNPTIQHTLSFNELNINEVNRANKQFISASGIIFSFFLSFLHSFLFSSPFLWICSINKMRLFLSKWKILSFFKHKQVLDNFSLTVYLFHIIVLNRKRDKCHTRFVSARSKRNPSYTRLSWSNDISWTIWARPLKSYFRYKPS